MIRQLQQSILYELSRKATAMSNSTAAAAVTKNERIPTLPTGEAGSLLDTVIGNTPTRQVYATIENKMGAIESLGKSFAQSGLLGVKSEPQGQVVALTCMCEGITPLEFSRRYHIIEGNVSMRSDYMLAEFVRRGGEYKIIDRTPELAAVEMKYGRNKEKFSLSHEQAKQEPFYLNKEGQAKKNYASPRSRMQMLWARVTSDGVRTLCPEIVAGVYTPEEIADLEPMSPAPPQRPELQPTPIPPGPSAAESGNVERGTAPKPEASSPASTPTEPSKPAEQPPFDAGPTNDVASLEQLTRIVELAGQLTNENTGEPFTPGDVKAAIKASYGFNDPHDLPRVKADELIARFEGLIEKKSQSAT